MIGLDAVLELGTAAWIVVATVPFVVLPLLARRRFAFGAPVAVCVVAEAAFAAGETDASRPATTRSQPSGLMRPG